MPTYGNPANPTMGQYFKQKPWFGGATPEAANRLAWSQLPMTNDMLSGQETYQRSQAAHNAYMRGSALTAMSDNDFLATATDDELGNLQGAPRTEREMRLQKIIQGDVLARERGASLIPSESEKLTFQGQQLGVDHASLANAAARLNLQQDPLAFALQQKTGEANLLHATNADARGEHADTRAGQQHDFQKANWQLNQDMEVGRYQNTLAQARQQTNAAFQQSQAAVRKGELSAEALIQSTPGFTPAQQQVLRAHEAAFRQEAGQAAMFAAKQNAAVAASAPKGKPAVPASSFLGFSYGAQDAVPPTPERIDQARRFAITEQERLNRTSTFYNPSTQTFTPLAQYANVPAPMAPMSTPGNTEPWMGTGEQFPLPPSYGAPPSAGPLPGKPIYKQGPDGFLYQIINGVPHKTNLRR